jgi:hypothetical protein
MEKNSLEQAPDEIAERIGEIKESYGAEDLCEMSGDGRTDHWLGRRFLNLFGSSNHIGDGHH